MALDGLFCSMKNMKSGSGKQFSINILSLLTLKTCTCLFTLVSVVHRALNALDRQIRKIDLCFRLLMWVAVCDRLMTFNCNAVSLVCILTIMYHHETNYWCLFRASLPSLFYLCAKPRLTDAFTIDNIFECVMVERFMSPVGVKLKVVMCTCGVAVLKMPNVSSLSVSNNKKENFLCFLRLFSLNAFL